MLLVFGQASDAALQKCFASQPLLEDVQFVGQMVLPRTVVTLVTCCPRLRRLTLSGLGWISGDVLSVINKHARNLEYLDILATRFSDGA